MGISTHRDRDKMAAILQTTFSKSFSSKKMLVFCFQFRLILFLEVQLTRIQHWFRKWLGSEQSPSHYLNRWLSCLLALFDLVELTRYTVLSNIPASVNTMVPGDAYMRQWTKVTIALGNGLSPDRCQPISWSNAVLLATGHLAKYSVKFWLKGNDFQSSKCIWKSLQNGVHFVSVSVF